MEEMESRAQRHLDGMKVNRDEMAKDVLHLSKTVRALQVALMQSQNERVVIRPQDGQKLDDGFKEAMSSIFGSR
jgi:hypothetical protein